MVSHNGKAVSGDYDILKVAFHINNFGGLLRGSGTLAKVRVCPLEVRALQLGSLQGSTASEGHLDRALKDIINREAANIVILEFDDEFAIMTGYKTMVRPTIEYACPVWNPHQQYLSDKLEKIQRNVSR